MQNLVRCCAALALAMVAMATVPVAGAAEPLKLVIYGGSGNIGQRIVREALDRGHQVTVVSRDPSRVKVTHDRLTVVQGNVLEPDKVM